MITGRPKNNDAIFKVSNLVRQGSQCFYLPDLSNKAGCDTRSFYVKDLYAYIRAKRQTCSVPVTNVTLASILHNPSLSLLMQRGRFYHEDGIPGTESLLPSQMRKNIHYAFIPVKRLRSVIYQNSPLKQDITQGRFLRGVPIHMNMHTDHGQKIPYPHDYCYVGIDITLTQPPVKQDMTQSRFFLNAHTYAYWSRTKTAKSPLPPILR